MRADPFDPPYPDLRLPAEWEPQAATWLTWPQNAATWTPVWGEARSAYAGAIKAILKHQDLCLLADTPKLRDELEGRFAPFARGGRKLEVLHRPTNDSWIRDYGSLIAYADGGRKRVALDFRFNSWGGKYPPWDLDNEVPGFMAAHRGIGRLELDFVLEGGSIDVNGAGKLLTTKSCLLNPNRNPGRDQGRIEAVLHHCLGARDILWLEGGIDGDDTDGHVDDLARFTDPRTVFCAIEEDKRDENYAALRANMSTLEGYARRMDLEVVEIPMPKRLVKADLRTPATYLNFLVLNGAVLVPVFLDKRDDNTLQAFEKHFPGREIIPLDCRGLVFGQGAIHCSSMQEPAPPA